MRPKCTFPAESYRSAVRYQISSIQKVLKDWNLLVTEWRTYVVCIIGVMKALQCPFLTRIPIGQVRQQAGELLKMADLCPVMGHVIKYASEADELTGTTLTGPEGKYFSSRASCDRNSE